MSVSVDGTARYVWPVSTGRPGYDTPNGIFKANRMDADHLSQEWENAPMPHTIFFDVRGHAVHGFFDVKHLGLPVSHGCVRLSPAHAATLFDLVKAEGMNQTTIVVSGHTPAGGLELVSRRAPVSASSSRMPGQRGMWTFTTAFSMALLLPRSSSSKRPRRRPFQVGLARK
jgi:L,D-transpeptidase catalytic domain